jgi:heptosyltransferase-2
VPTVALFGPTHIEWTDTHFERELHVQHKVPCGPCQQRECPLGHHQCMNDLGVDRVFDACARLLRGGVRKAA